MGGDGLILEVDGEGMVVGLSYDLFANSPGRHGIGVSIKADGEIGVHLKGSRVAAIRKELWQRPHGLSFEAIDWFFPCSAMDSDISHMVSPVVCLSLQII